MGKKAITECFDGVNRELRFKQNIDAQRTIIRINYSGRLTYQFEISWS